MQPVPAQLSETWWFVPLCACLVLTGIHCRLGIHVVARQVIFVDLAMAQVAALGAIVAAVYGRALLGVLGGSEPGLEDALGVAPGRLFDPGGPVGWACGLVFTLIGAGVLAFTRMRSGRIPQEALIGVVYAVSAAGAILLVDLSGDAHAGEHVKELLTGSIVWVSGRKVAITAAIYALVAVVHVLARRPFREISEDPAGAAARGRNVRAWDFLFYATFGIVITGSVQIAGVLLVFAYLIVPAVIAMLTVDGFRGRLAVGWAIGATVSMVGIAVSFERVPGPVIVVLFGLLLSYTAVAQKLLARTAWPRALRIGVGTAGAAAVLALAGWFVSAGGPAGGSGLGRAAGHSHAHDHSHEPASPAGAGAGAVDTGTAAAIARARADLADRDPRIRDLAIEALLELRVPEAARLACPHLERDLEHPDARIRRLTVGRIARLKDAGARQLLKAHLARETDEAIRLEIEGLLLADE